MMQKITIKQAKNAGIKNLYDRIRRSMSNREKKYQYDLNLYRTATQERFRSNVVFIENEFAGFLKECEHIEKLALESETTEDFVGALLLRHNIINGMRYDREGSIMQGFGTSYQSQNREADEKYKRYMSNINGMHKATEAYNALLYRNNLIYYHGYENVAVNMAKILEFDEDCKTKKKVVKSD